MIFNYNCALQNIFDNFSILRNIGCQKKNSSIHLNFHKMIQVILYKEKEMEKIMNNYLVNVKVT